MTERTEYVVQLRRGDEPRFRQGTPFSTMAQAVQVAELHRGRSTHPERLPIHVRVEEIRRRVVWGPER